MVNIYILCFMNIYIKLYIFIYLILLLLFARFLLRKGELHYKLLKELLPENLKNANFYTFLFTFNCFKLEFDNFIWFFFPFYFTRKKIYSCFSENSISLHRKLIKNNKIVLLIFLIIVIWIYGVGYFVILFFD